jgi:Flp pilus assembly protein TadD
MTQSQAAEAARAFQRGESLARAARWVDARQAFLTASRLAPQASLTWLSLALASWELNLYEDAAKAIQWTLRAVPILDTPDMREGIAHVEAGRWAEGQAAFESALAERVPDSAPHLLLCLCYLRQGKTDEARRHLQTGYELEDAGG